jgi:RNA polymerase-associated protein RTF1
MKDSEILLIAGKEMPKRKKGVYNSKDDDKMVDLFVDSDDRENLMSMPETKREEILFERHNIIRKMDEKRELNDKIKELEKIRREEKVEAFDPIDTSTKDDSIDFRSLASCVLNRDFLFENIYKPFFSEIIGNFVRISFEHGYSLWKIIGITEGDIYSAIFRKKEVKTNKLLKITNGQKEYEMKIANVSNSSLTEEEFNSLKNHIKLPKRKMLVSRFKNLKKLFQRELTDLENTEKIIEESRFYSTKKNMTLLKIDLIQKRDRALEKKDYKSADRFQKHISEIEGREEPKEDVWARINERNRKLNYEISRMAEEKNRDSNESEDVLNPFKRRKTREYLD